MLTSQILTTHKHPPTLPRSPEQDSWRQEAERQVMAIRAALRDQIRRQKASGNPPSAETVKAFAALCLTDDARMPITPAPLHDLWLRLICDRRIQNLLIIAPPESAKTTWLLTGFTACEIGFYPERSNIIACSATDVAETRSKAIQAIVQGAAFRAIFPDVLPAAGLAYTSTEWSVAPNGRPRPGRIHPTVAAYGTGGAITGSRSDLTIGDDIHDFENSRTAHQRSVVDTWLHNSLFSRSKAETGRKIIIGTPWHHDDSYAKLRRLDNWVVCHTPALSEGKEVYATIQYPDSWRHEVLGEVVAAAEVV